MDIIYKINILPSAADIIVLYKNSGLPRPVDDAERIKKMFDNADIVITAWCGDILIGIARSLTDYCWCCYLSDLAVLNEFQSKGVGRKLIDLTKEVAGSQSMLLLLSVPGAMDYYAKIGFGKVDNGFIMSREN